MREQIDELLWLAEMTPDEATAIDELVEGWRRLEAPPPPGPRLSVAVFYRNDRPLLMAPDVETLRRLHCRGGMITRWQ